MNISVLVGLKNNLEYSKEFYRLFRELYSEEELCFVSYGSTDETHEWLNSLKDSNLKYFYSEEKKTFSDTFNKAAEIATKDYIIFLHNDIIPCENLLENVLKHVGENKVVSYTTTEPPIFPGHDRPGKIIREFGRDFWSTDYKGLARFVKEEQERSKDRTSEGAVFFMCLFRSLFLSIGGFDNLFNPMFCEDDDLIRRLKQSGAETITSLDALCYHFVSKTSRFSEEIKNKTQEIEYYSNLNFTRKWGRGKNVRDVGTVLIDCAPNFLLIEPYLGHIYTTQDISAYIKDNQPYTKFDLSKRITQIPSYSENLTGLHDIVVVVDREQSVNSTADMLANISSILENSKVETGVYLLKDTIKIYVNSLQTRNDEYVYVNCPFYQDQLRKA